MVEDRFTPSCPIEYEYEYRFTEYEYDLPSFWLLFAAFRKPLAPQVVTA
jgi:hypothetical protein